MAAAKRAIDNQRGVAMVEATISLLVVVSITSGLCAILYMSFARVWIERSSYEAVICLATSVPASVCEQNLKQQIQSALPIGELRPPRLSRDRHKAQVEVSFAFADKDMIRHTDSRKLPLKTSRGRGP